MDIHLKQIGVAHNKRQSLQDDFWSDVITTIQLDDKYYQPDATLKLDQFSHLLVIFYMHKVIPEKIVTGARHPRNNPKLPKVGILTQRTKNRINKIGCSYAELLSVDGLEIQVRGLDVIDTTPILDIKPCIQAFLPRGEIHEPEWVSQIMQNYYE